MNTEIEAKWLGIDHDEFREKLIKLGAKQICPKTDMVRTVFDLPGKDSNKDKEWARVRDEGDKVTMSYKRTDDRNLAGTKEICLEVDSYENAVEFMSAMGCRQKSIEETRRETWELDGAEIDLDEWPWLPPFIEIETKDEASMPVVAAKLGLDVQDAMCSSADLVYAYYYDVTPEEVNNHQGIWKEMRFSPVPKELEAKRKKK